MSRPSLAERYRRHNEEMKLALELGITPKEARARIEAIAARERTRAARDRLDARINAPLRPATAFPEAERDPQPWMMRD